MKRMQKGFVVSLLSMIFRVVLFKDDKNYGKDITCVAAELTPISNCIEKQIIPHVPTDGFLALLFEVLVPLTDIR